MGCNNSKAATDNVKQPEPGNYWNITDNNPKYDLWLYGLIIFDLQLTLGELLYC